MGAPQEGDDEAMQRRWLWGRRVGVRHRRALQKIGVKGRT